jgi:hypothetical protein
MKIEIEGETPNEKVMSNNRMPAAIAAESRSAPAASVVMTHDDYLARLQMDPYFRPTPDGDRSSWARVGRRSEEHTSELQSRRR